MAFPPGQLAGTLTAIRAVAAGAGVVAAIRGSAVTGILEVKIPGSAPAVAVAQFAAALRAELGRAGALARAPAGGQG